MNPSSLSRRKFLKDGSCTAMSSLGVLSTLLNLRMMGNAVGNTTSSGQSKALVCLFLNGGNDSYNMLVPSGAEYANYAAMRSNMALGSSSLLGLNRADDAKTPLNNGRDFDINSAMPELQGLFDSGKLAFVSNVGTLVEPTTLSQYSNRSVELPRSLFAHNFQKMEWQTSVPQGGVTTGWMGRMADLLNSTYNTGKVSMNMSLAGNQTMLLGDTIIPYSLTESGGVALNESGTVAQLSSTKSLMEQSYKNLYEQAFADETKTSIELNAAFKEAFDNAQISTIFPSAGGLGGRLKAIARSIASQSVLGHERQTYFVQLGGFDNHSNLLTRHPLLLSYISQAVGAFWSALQELQMEDQVTLFTASDFSRTIRSNGAGSDHAWGANHFVMGGAVDGQKIYGKYPDPTELRVASGLDVGTNGRMLPSISTDEYFAEMALWLGVSQSDLSSVFPNLANFWTGSGAPVGFMK